MLLVSEAGSAALATHEMAYAAVKEALIAVRHEGAKTFPVVLGHGSDPANRFTVKASTAAEGRCHVSGWPTGPGSARVGG
jgi:ornithine cyclodeaminase